jgi:type I restriction enzyme, S subunit
MEMRRLGDVLDTAKGKKPEKLYDEPIPGRIPYIDIAAIESGEPRQFADPNGSRIVQPGTLLMVWDGARSGWVGFAPFQGALGSTLAALESPLDSGFLASFLRFNFKAINTNHRGSGIPHVNPDFLFSLQVPVFSPTKQKAIATRAESVSNTALRSQQHVVSAVQRADELRAGVIAAACDGRLTTDWRDSREDLPRADDLVEKLSREREKSVLRWKQPNSADGPEGFEWQMDVQVPENWAVVPVGVLIAAQNGRAFPSKEYRDTGVRLLRPGNLKADGTLTWTEKNTAHLPPAWAGRFPDYLLGQGELLMNLTAQSLKDAFLGRVCLKTDEEPALLNQRIARFRPFGETDVRPYLFLYFRSPRFRAYVARLDTGTLIRHMHTKSVLAHMTPLPPIDEQRAILDRVAKFTKRLDEAENHAERAGDRINRLQDAVLTRAFRLAA